MFQNAHETLESTMKDVTAEQAHWLPPGKALPISSLYAHTIGGEDACINMLIRKTPPLLATDWANRTGMSVIMPETQPWDDWARSVRVDLDQLRKYAQAVYAATDDYLAGLTPENLDVEIDFAGKRPIGDALARFLVGHVNQHCGEISALKGLQGAKGYPF